MDEQKRELLGWLESVERHVGTAHPPSQEGLTDGQVLVVALFAGCLRMFRATRLLLAEGLVEEAQIIARTMTDDTTTLIYFWKHESELEELAIRFKYGSLEELRSLAEFAKDQGYEGADDDLAQCNRAVTRLAEVARSGKFQLKRLPKLRDRLSAVGKPERYWFYKRASHAVHTTLASLRLIEKSPDHYEVRLTDPPGQVMAVGSLAADTMMSALIAAANLLKWDTLDAVLAFRKHMDEKLMALGRAADCGFPRSRRNP